MYGFYFQQTMATAVSCTGLLTTGCCRQSPADPPTVLSTPSAVTLVFPEHLCPERLVFVVHQADQDAWVRDHGANFSLQLRSPCLNDMVEGVLAAEGGYEHWGLLHRLQRVLEVLDNAEAAGAAGMAFVFTWLRFSSNRLLDWQRCFSYQPRDITWAQQQVAERIAAKARSAVDPAVRMFCRITLSKLSRGGGNGDEIRMGILNIMRDHGIKEGNRGGVDEPFLEQWHQKLHQATSPEDVIIAEAYLAFLHTGNHDEWWRVLHENGGITKERLESWEQPITGNLAGAGDIMLSSAAWLKPYWQAAGSSRDLLLLDIALESWLRLLVERQDKRSLSGDDLVELMGLVLANAALTGTSHELELVSAQWEAVRAAGDRWSRGWCLAASAALGRVTLALSAFADDICGLVQPYAELFGLRCGIQSSHILNFSEEVVRDQALFVGSLLAAELEPRLRTAAGASSWQVVSQVASATGEVVVLPNLLGVQGVAFNQPTVVLAQALGGMEDIPDGVVALLTRSSTDVLSHVAIRARTQGVLMAGCADDEEWRHLVDVEGSGAGLELRVLQEDEFNADVVGAKACNLVVLRQKLPDWILVPRSVALPFGSFEAVLADPTNADLAAELSGIQQQLEAVLIYGALAKAGLINAPPPSCGANSSSQGGSDALAAAQGQAPSSSNNTHHADASAGGGGSTSAGEAGPTSGSSAGPDAADAACSRRQHQEQLAVPVAVKYGPEWEPGNPNCPAWLACWAAVCGVWASKWNHRAWLSRRSAGLPEEQLAVSVLLQQVLPAEYAFVLHTASPFSGARGEMYGELVCGLGETLVGNHPGRPLAFSDRPDGTDLQLLALPSKRLGLFTAEQGTLIARSDTNGEDLAGYAGAGLYDSIPVVPLEARCPDYAREPLLWESAFRQQLLDGLVELGYAVESAFDGQPQDIEGVWIDGRFAVVQSRPQIMHCADPSSDVGDVRNQVEQRGGEEKEDGGEVRVTVLVERSE
eukprot:gene4810-5058_t